MNRYHLIKQKKENQYVYCGLLQYDEYFIGSEGKYIQKVGSLALKNNGLVLYDPIENSNVLLSLHQGNCLIESFANGKYIDKSDLKRTLQSLIQNSHKTESPELTVIGYNI